MELRWRRGVAVERQGQRKGRLIASSARRCDRTVRLARHSAGARDLPKPVLPKTNSRLPATCAGAEPAGRTRLAGGLFAPRDRYVVAARRAGIELARTTDLLLRVLDHLLPLCDPADRARDREQHGEHGGREAHRLERDARIEIDVRIKLLLDEIFVAQRDLLKLHGHVEQRIVLDAEL